VVVVVAVGHAYPSEKEILLGCGKIKEIKLGKQQK